MSIVALPLRLCQREINGISWSTLTFNMDKLYELWDDEFGENEEDISNILIWMAKKHPEILIAMAEDFVTEELATFTLNFQDSWENPDELISTDALAIIMKSDFGEKLAGLRGYVDPKALRKIARPLYNMSLAIGRHTDVCLLFDEIKSVLVKNSSLYSDIKEKIWIHLRCGEIDLNDVGPLPVISNLTLFISNVSDEDEAWVVEANATFRKPNLFLSIDNESNIFANMDNLFLPRSKLTKAGVEAICKGLVDRDLGVAWLAVSSSCLADDTNWRQMIEKKYDFGYVSLCNDKDIRFT